ncbi:MAG: DapH/DapD/GlmU-related protein [Negativicutes bacterium]|nr:DapH/DapD/GlmU-related protein [Negativicutes bacterium]
MYKLLKMLLQINYFLIRYMRKRMFGNNALIGVNTVFGLKSRCLNLTEHKKSIIIGNNCDISGTIIARGQGRVEIGDDSFIGDGATIGAVERIVIGRYSIISNHVHIYDNNNHPTDPQLRKKMCQTGIGGELWGWEYAEYKPIIIEENVWICEFSCILKGVTVGKGAIVASHAVVTKDVPPYTIVAGTPAKVVKQLKPI